VGEWGGAGNRTNALRKNSRGDAQGSRHCEGGQWASGLVGGNGRGHPVRVCVNPRTTSPDASRGRKG